MNEPNIDGHYSFQDWYSLPDVVRTELYDGKVRMMSIPTPMHQMVSLKLTLQIGAFLGGNTYQFFHAPIGVKLFPDRDIVVSPDALVISDIEKIGEKVILGAPDIVIEIMSPSDMNYETTEKLGLYLKSGVREYWIVCLEAKMVIVYILRNSEYSVRVHALSSGDTEIRTGILPELRINLLDVFGV